MTLRRITQGSRFEAEIGYARAVVDETYVHVSGTTGYDYAAHTLAVDVVEQCAQALSNIAWALGQAGVGFADVVRVQYFLTDAADFRPCWPLLRQAFAEGAPAATMLVVAGLAEPTMKIEIEVTARRR